MPKEPSVYEKRKAAAVAVLEKAGIRLTMERVTAAPLCPDWGRAEALRAGFPKGPCRRCGGTHGDHYRVTVQRFAPVEKAPRHVLTPIASYAFDFWGAYTGSVIEIERTDNGNPMGRGPRRTYKAPEVVDCILSDLGDERTPDDVYSEYGPMEPSRCQAVAEHGNRLRQVIPEDVATAARAALEGEG